MTFKVTPADILLYAAQLQESYGDVGYAKNYVHVYGDFSFHEAGVIGALAGQHADFMHQLDELHNQLLTILLRSGDALADIATTYDETDMSVSSRIDATYPASPRPTRQPD